MPEKKAYVNGVEIVTRLTYTGWQPGFEYIKNLTFKNLNTRTVKIFYIVPKSRFFTTLHPKIISLSPGTTFTLPITFRPLDKIKYEDCIEVNQIDFQNVFKIPLKADLPQFKIDLAKELDMGPCASGEYIEKQIRIKNCSELDTLFEWDVREPFMIKPMSGEIPAHSFIDITVLFNPKAALVYKCIAVCKYGHFPLNKSELHNTLEIYGVGKYPHLLVEDETQVSATANLDFGSNIMGQSVTKYVSIINMTEVTTNYFIERQNEIPIFDTCFNCLQVVGCLQPYEKQKIPIIYAASVPNEDVIHDYFNVYSSGKLSRNIINCSASNYVPRVQLDRDIINFDLCNEHDKVAKTFNIINCTSMKLSFQFDIDSTNSSFEFTLNNGVLQPNERKLIQVFFKPQFASIYYKKIPCIIQNHDVLFIELIGTAHSELVKPPVINRKHIENYYYLKKEGLLNNTPEQLMELFTKKKIQFDDAKIHEEYVAKQNESEKLLTEEYMCDRQHFNNPKSLDDINTQILIDDYYVDFGASQVDVNDEEINDQRSITVTNNTKGKVVMSWNVNDDQAFSISPVTCEIPPLKNYSFRIKFQPKGGDQFYKVRLEGFALYKALTNYTLAETKFIIPAWCLNIECIGHTFHPANDTHFIPRYITDAENIIFPVTVREKPVYRTLIVKNLADQYPLTFDFTNLNNDEWFVKPHKGLIKAKEHQIFIFRFAPKIDSYFVDKCEISLNNLANHLLEIALVGAGVTPKIRMENQGFLYFSPTCKNNFTVQSYELVNQTRGKLCYEWKIPYEYKKILSVDETTQCMEPHQVKQCMWRFAPDKIDKYNCKVMLVAWIEGDRKNFATYGLRLLGECTYGSLQAAEMYKDFGSVIVGSSVTSEITVINNNDCPMDYELFVKQTSDDPLADKTVCGICVLEIEKPIGHVEARSRATVRCRLRPTRLISYQFTIEYRIIYPNEEEPAGSDRTNPDTPRNVRETFCYMTANGVYPKLKVNDIKCLGSASTLSQDYFWRLLSIDHLNAAMNNEPNAEELVYSIATRQEANRRQCNSNTKPIIDMNFSAAPAKSENTKVIFFFENVGTVPAEWVLLYPKDLLLELEYWAQTGEYDMDELDEMKVQDNKLFTIEPKKGFVDPGETVQIHVTYKHIFPGVNKLPVLFKISKGREILLNLVGTTVNNDEPNIHFPSSLYEFEPIEIGLTEYPIQIYEIYNGGNVACDVEIDSSAVAKLNEDNYAHTILKCLTESRIRIEPGALFETKWIFSPIEAKTYNADIRFLVNGKDLSLVTFKCIGFDKKNLQNITIASRMQEQCKIKSRLLPNQLASLSAERLSLGDIPLFTRERKMIFVKNNSSKNQIKFTWHVTNAEHSKYIRIQPSKGVIDVNQSRMCKVTFISQDKPSFYNIDLICEIKNEEDTHNYQQQLELWQNEQKRQFEEFVIDEKELESRLKGSVKEVEKRDIKTVSNLSIHRFKTIPPIMKNASIEESNVDKSRRQREEKKIWKKPSPPQPFLLHLNVITRTQYIEEYLNSKNTVKTECEKFFDASLGNLLDVSPEVPQEDEKEKTIPATKDEKQTIDFVMSNLMRNLISDKSFHKSILKLKDESIPYFFQYTSETSKQDINNQQSKKKTPTKTDELTDHALKSSTEFGSMIEGLLENTISNILTEAFNREFSLTSRPRLIALPPKSSHGQNQLTTSMNTLTQSKLTATRDDIQSLTSPASPTLSESKSMDMMSNVIKSEAEPIF